MTTAKIGIMHGKKNGNFNKTLAILHDKLDELKAMMGEDWDESRYWEKGNLLAILANESTPSVDVNDIADWIAVHHPEVDPHPEMPETDEEYWNAMGNYLYRNTDDKALTLIACYWAYYNDNPLTMRSEIVDRYAAHIIYGRPLDETPNVN